MGDLQDELRKLSDETTPLADRLERVKVSSETIWNSPRLPWFTDHRAHTHSRQLIVLLGQILDHVQTTVQRLTRSELFILLSACYLHDIGMQDLVVGDRSMENLNADDFELIRKRHPERGKNLIVGGTLRLERDDIKVDLDDDPGYLQPIALVSQGHGSEFFDETVATLNTKAWAPDGQAVVRGALLAALLLIADELDVRCERTAFPKGALLSPVSALHHFVNHYVTSTSVGPGSTSNKRRVRIQFEFPPDSDSYRLDIRQFLINKLARQIRRVNATLVPSTDDELSLETAIAVREETDDLGVRRQLSEAPLLELQEQVRRSKLVDREPLVEGLTNQFASTASSIISLKCDEESDLAAVLDWLIAAAATANRRIFDLSFRPAIGRDAHSVLADLVTQCGCDAGDIEQEGSPTLSSGIVEAVLSMMTSEPSLLLLRDFEAAEGSAMSTILDLADAARRSTGSLVTVIAHDGTVSCNEDFGYRLGSIDRSTLAAHLRDCWGYSEEDADRKANRMYILSTGAAEPIVTRLAFDRAEYEIDA